MGGRKGSAAVNYYERHLGDYARDTGHLTPLEHGVYNLLLDRYYASESGIPADQAHRICRARTKEERDAVDAVLAEFFSLDGEVYRQGRVEAEIDKARARIDSARSNGKRGGRPKKNPSGFDFETQEKPSGFSSGSDSKTQSKAHQTPDTRHQAPDQEQASPSSTSSPSTDLLGAEPADLKVARAQRLAQVTHEAIETFNASALVKTNGGLLPNVSESVGRERRQRQVARCVRVARDICAEGYSSQTITREFWIDYWATCAADEHKSGRRGGGKDHPNWKPSFEYLTREATMLELYDRATSDAAA